MKEKKVLAAFCAAFVALTVASGELMRSSVGFGAISAEEGMTIGLSGDQPVPGDTDPSQTSSSDSEETPASSDSSSSSNTSASAETPVSSDSSSSSNTSVSVETPVSSDSSSSSNTSVSVETPVSSESSSSSNTSVPTETPVSSESSSSSNTSVPAETPVSTESSSSAVTTAPIIITTTNPYIPSYTPSITYPYATAAPAVTAAATTTAAASEAEEKSEETAAAAQPVEVKVKVDDLEAAAKVPAKNKVKNVSVVPADDLKDKDGNEIDLSEVTLGAKEIFNPETVKAAKEAVEKVLDAPAANMNVVDLSMKLGKTDLSKSFDGKIAVTIEIPKGQKGKQFKLYRLVEVDGELTAELVEGTLTDAGYEVELDELGVFVLVAEDEAE